MPLFLRFTKDTVIQNSFDHFTNDQFDGTCCYEIDEAETMLSIREVAEKDSTFLKEHDGQFVVFSGTKTMDNPYGYGVIAKCYEVIAIGKLSWNESAHTFKFDTYEDL